MKITDFLHKIFNFGSYRKRFGFIKREEVNSEDIKQDNLYLEYRGGKNRWLYLKCPCGCNENISVNLMKSVYPNWSLYFNKNGGVDLYPSIQKETGCKSHFYIKDSQIVWAESPKHS